MLQLRMKELKRRKKLLVFGFVLKDRHGDAVVEVKAFDEHPQEHGGPRVLQQDVESFAQHRLMEEINK